MTADSKKSSFEESLKQLEVIVERMENGDQPLEKSLEDFERGIQIVRDCRTLLQQAELKIQELSREDVSAADTPSRQPRNTE